MERSAPESDGRRAAERHAPAGGIGAALRSDDCYEIVRQFDDVAAAAVALIGTASGTLRSRAIALSTPEDMDAVAERMPDFRPPGR